MSAGRAGSSLYNSNINGNQGGGNKKGGLATTTNKRVQYVIPAIRSRAYSSPDQRKMIYCVNQLGGIGAPSKMFATTADGSCASCSKEAKAHNFVVLAYRQLLGRGADEGGLRKYTKQILNDPRGLCVGMKQVEADLIASPEGRKCISKLGTEEAQKRVDIVNEYIKKACTVVPVLENPQQKKCEDGPFFDIFKYLCNCYPDIIPGSEQIIPYDGSTGGGKINFPGARVSLMNNYLIQKKNSITSVEDQREEIYIKGKLTGSEDSGCINLYAEETLFFGLIYDFSGVENIDTMDSSTVLGQPATIKLGSKEQEAQRVFITTGGQGRITKSDLDENYKFCKLSTISDSTYACDSGDDAFDADGELSGCILAHPQFGDADDNKNNSSAFIDLYENNQVKIKTISLMTETDYTLPRSICMQLPSKNRE